MFYLNSIYVFYNLFYEDAVFFILLLSRDKSLILITPELSWVGYNILLNPKVSFCVASTSYVNYRCVIVCFFTVLLFTLFNKKVFFLSD